MSWVETREEASIAVLQVFGREPLVEDWRCVGRWAYAAAWLASDYETARDLVCARLAGTAVAATNAAMAAGKGDSERYALVSAMARLTEALESRRGALADAVERMVDEAASRLVEDGAALRDETYRERKAFAPLLNLEGFDAGLREVGQDRHIMLRESGARLDEILSAARGTCPALRAMRLYLQATLAIDPSDAAVPIEGGEATSEDGFVGTVAIWLTADLALTARRASAFGVAWGSAAKLSGDALSKTLAGLTSGAMLAHNVVESLERDPWALVSSLAMTAEPQHSTAVLDCGVQAQSNRRVRAARAVSEWARQAGRVDDLERRLKLEISVAYADRQGHRDFSNVGALDLFSAWYTVCRAEEARAALTEATQRALTIETARRRDAVRRAKVGLEKIRAEYEAAVEAARKSLAGVPASVVNNGEDEGTQRGCVFGFGAGCAVMTTYVVIGLFLGTGGIVGKVAPLVVGVAALPIAAAIFVQIGYAMRRAARTAESLRQQKKAAETYDRARKLADETHGQAFARGREALAEAEEQLDAFERQIGSDQKVAA